MTEGYFRVFGAPIARGRTFTPDEDCAERGAGRRPEPRVLAQSTRGRSRHRRQSRVVRRRPAHRHRHRRRRLRPARARRPRSLAPVCGSIPPRPTRHITSGRGAARSGRDASASSATCATAGSTTSPRRRCTCRRRSCRTRSTRSSWATSRSCGPCTRRAPPAQLASAIESELRQVTGVPVLDTETMESVVAISTSRERFNMLLMSIFGGAALVLAALGIYGSARVLRAAADAGARHSRRARRRAAANQRHDAAAGRAAGRRAALRSGSRPRSICRAA